MEVNRRVCCLRVMGAVEIEHVSRVNQTERPDAEAMGRVVHSTRGPRLRTVAVAGEQRRSHQSKVNGSGVGFQGCRRKRLKCCICTDIMAVKTSNNHAAMNLRERGSPKLRAVPPQLHVKRHAAAVRCYENNCVVLRPDHLHAAGFKCAGCGGIDGAVLVLGDGCNNARGGQLQEYAPSNHADAVKVAHEDCWTS